MVRPPEAGGLFATNAKQTSRRPASNLSIIIKPSELFGHSKRTRISRARGPQFGSPARPLSYAMGADRAPSAGRSGARKETEAKAKGKHFSPSRRPIEYLAGLPRLSRRAKGSHLAVFLSCCLSAVRGMQLCNLRTNLPSRAEQDRAQHAFESMPLSVLLAERGANLQHLASSVPVQCRSRVHSNEKQLALLRPKVGLAPVRLTSLPSGIGRHLKG